MTTKQLYVGYFSVGVQSGGPDDGGIFRTKIKLFKILDEKIDGTHIDGVNHIWIAYRVAGKFVNWGDDKIERIRKDNIRKYISCDIVVSQHTVDSLNEGNVKKFVCSSIRDALELIYKRMDRDKVKNDKNKFLVNYDECVSCFMNQ